MAKALVLQTWFDIALQYTGDASNAVAIAAANNRSITDDIVVGEALIIPADIPVLNKETQYLAGKDVIPSTGITKDDLETINPILGIGTMEISSTFIVD